MTKLCIDLCSGLGGFSQAFVDAGWEVIRVDYNDRFAKVPFTRIVDVRSLLKDKKFMALKPEVIITSPDCTYFSRADDWPRPGILGAMTTAGACLEIVAQMRPKYWALENPSEGMLRWLIGAPNRRMRMNSFGYRTVKRTGVWGNIPYPLAPFDAPNRNQKGVKWENGPRDAAVRSAITPAFSQYTLNAVDPEIKLAEEPSSKAQSPTAPPHPLQRGSEN